MDAPAQVSPAVVKAVAKELKKYMQTGRRENGFDDSRPGQVGAFSSTKGGSLYYSALQDKHLRRYFDKPSTKKHLFTTGTIPEHLLSPVERRAQMRLLGSDLGDSVGDDRLIHTVAGLLASGEWNAAKSSSRGKGRQVETPLWSPSSTSCSSSPAHSSRSHSNNSTVVLNSAEFLPTASVGEPHSNGSEPTSPQLKDEGEQGSSSSIADFAATGSQQSLHASRPYSATDGSKPGGSPTPSVPPAHSKHSKCSQGTQTIEDKVVQVDVVSTVDCGVHVPGTVEQATQTCPESGVQTDLSYLMQHCCSSYTAEERQGPTSIRQTDIAAMSMHKEIACHWEEVQGSVEMTPMAKGLNGSEQTQRRRDPSVVLGALSPGLPQEEGRRVERQQPCAVVSGEEQPVNLIKLDAEGAAVTEEEGGMGGNEIRGGDEALALEDKRVSKEHEAFQSERNML